MGAGGVEQARRAQGMKSWLKCLTIVVLAHSLSKKMGVYLWEASPPNPPMGDGAPPPSLVST